MAYLMITSICNMNCSHCCMSCGKNYKGQHMDDRTFQHALNFCTEYGDCITLGGGEPTLHPKFMDYLMRAIAQEQSKIQSGINPLVVTNGSVYEHAMFLATQHGEEADKDFWGYAKNYCIEYSEEGYFHAELSDDRHHDKSLVNENVYNVFNRRNALRDVGNREIKAGHWRGNYGIENRCVCPTVQVKPDGKIFLCGCDNSPCVGDVFHGLDDAVQNTEWDGCWNTPGCEKAVTAHEFYHNKMTNDDWVNNNILVKRNKIHHPETYRIAL